MPISFPGKEQKAAEGRRDHRSVKWEDERRVEKAQVLVVIP